MDATQELVVRVVSSVLFVLCAGCLMLAWGMCAVAAKQQLPPASPKMSPVAPLKPLKQERYAAKRASGQDAYGQLQSF